MSLDVYLEQVQLTEVYWANITHNLTEMADAAGLYGPVWHPEDNEIKTAADLIPVLKNGISRMEADPEHFKKFDASNGWGKYDQFLPWLRQYLAACEQHPDATVVVSR